jgi:hypothetical protein
MDLRIVGAPPPDVVARLAAIAPRFTTLAELLTWGLAQSPPCDIVDIVVQDEYTHDVVVRGPAPTYLCFDTT